jgi:type I restriction enzyme, S subunit
LVNENRVRIEPCYFTYRNYYENLPDCYVLTTLSFAGNWKSGATPQRGNTEYYGGDIPWIKTGELNNSIIYSSIEKVTEKALSKCSLPINDTGNILIAMYGATIGKLAIAGIPLTTNQACCGCKPFTGIHNKYLFYYLMANKQKFIDSAEGGAQPNISREKIIAYPFVLPPINEQIRISKKLDFILNQISH